MKRTLLAFFLLFAAFSPQGLKAQEQPDYERYAAEAGFSSPLYRTRLSRSYSIPFNGTYKMDTLGFRRGDLLYEGKLYHHLLLDIDASQQHLLLRHPSSSVVLDLGLDRVERFDLGGREFINLNAAGYPVAPGFFEVIASGAGTVVYRKIAKVFKTLPPDGRKADIGYEDPHYRTNVYDYFEPGEQWILIRDDGSVMPLKRKNDVLKAFPAERKTLQKRMSHARTEGLDRAAWTRMVLQILESLRHENR